MDFRSKSVYECKSPRLLRRLSIPLSASKIGATRPYRSVNLSTGELTYRFRKTEVYRDNLSVPFVVRCGKCENCRKYQNDEWANRMIMEYISRKGDVVPFFCTLSFDPRFDSNLACVDKTAIYREFVVPFKKRLRSYDVKFRFFCVSELGEQFGRFHFHFVFWIDLSDGLVHRSAEFAKKYAPQGADYFDSCRLFVKSADGSYRLQTDLECYIQYLIQRAWSDGKQRFECAPIINITWKDGLRRKSVTYPNQIGFVSCSQSESFGAYHYITSYSVKCLHDGVTTYHRQSPALGAKYVADNIRGSLDMLRSGRSIPDYWTDGQVPFVLPRFFVRKFMPDDLRIRRFWDYYSTLPTSYFVGAMPKYATVDNFDLFLDATSPLFYQSRPLSDKFDKVWLEALDIAHDRLFAGYAKKINVHKLYYKLLYKHQCTTTSNVTEMSTSEQLTLF